MALVEDGTLLGPRQLDMGNSGLNHMGVALAERDSWLQSIELYEPYAESPYEAVAGVLNKMGLQDSTIGVETTYLSATRWEEFKSLLPKARFIDCVRTMDEVRWVKTPGEVELLTEAANILDEAYLEVFSEVQEGDSERDVHSRIVASCLRRGAKHVHGLLNCSRNPMIFGGERRYPQKVCNQSGGVPSV